MIKILAELLQRVPDKIRGWVYLGLLIACLAFIGVTAWRDGFTVDQVVALFVGLVGALANSNRPTVKARTRERRNPTSLEE